VAKHKSLKSFGKALIEASKTGQENIFAGIREAALVTDQVVVLTTPVDSGYARSRWTVSIGDPIAAEIGVQKRIEVGEELGTSIAFLQAGSEIKKWKGVGSIFISNPLEYVIYLDQGSSVQAPSGMTDDAVNAGQAVLREIRMFK
jgi:hypothetical protein